MIYKTKKIRKLERLKSKKNKVLFKNKTKKNKKYKYSKKVKVGGSRGYMDIIREFENINIENNQRNKNSQSNKKNYYHLPKGVKIFAFADVHGDFKLLVKLLEIAGVMKSNVKLPKPKKIVIEVDNRKYNYDRYDENEMQEYFDNLEWTGGNNYVVQIGDQIDRTRNTKTHEVNEDEGSTFEIIYLLLKLNELAVKYNNSQTQKIRNNGGQKKYVFSMLGNHEIMNVENDLRYCSLGEFDVFKKRLNKSRREAYKTGGMMANLMSIHYHTLLHIGPFIFVHGGLPLEIVSNYTLNEINNIVSKYLRGNELNKKDRDVIVGDNSPLWNREMSKDSHKDVKSLKLSDSGDIPILTKLREIMEIYITKNKGDEKYRRPQVMCVGHTPQYFENEDANLLLSDPLLITNEQKTYKLQQNEQDVLRLDTGASRAFGVVKDKGAEKDKFRRPQIAILSMNNDGSIDIVIKS